MIEQIAHIRVHDRDYNVYISFSYTTMTLHAYKYDEYNMEYCWFASLSEFKSWVAEDIRRVP